jgi:hypothetical protein
VQQHFDHALCGHSESLINQDLWQDQKKKNGMFLVLFIVMEWSRCRNCIEILLYIYIYICIGSWFTHPGIIVHIVSSWMKCFDVKLRWIPSYHCHHAHIHPTKKTMFRCTMQRIFSRAFDMTGYLYHVSLAPATSSLQVLDRCCFFLDRTLRNCTIFFWVTGGKISGSEQLGEDNNI